LELLRKIDDLKNQNNIIQDQIDDQKYAFSLELQKVQLQQDYDRQSIEEYKKYEKQIDDQEKKYYELLIQQNQLSNVNQNQADENSYIEDLEKQLLLDRNETDLKFRDMYKKLENHNVDIQKQLTDTITDINIQAADLSKSITKSLEETKDNIELLLTDNNDKLIIKMEQMLLPSTPDASTGDINTNSDIETQIDEQKIMIDNLQITLDKLVDAQNTSRNIEPPVVVEPTPVVEPTAGNSVSPNSNIANNKSNFMDSITGNIGKIFGFTIVATGIGFFVKKIFDDKDKIHKITSQSMRNDLDIRNAEKMTSIEERYMSSKEKDINNRNKMLKINENKLINNALMYQASQKNQLQDELDILKRTPEEKSHYAKLDNIRRDVELNIIDSAKERVKKEELKKMLSDEELKTAEDADKIERQSYIKELNLNKNMDYAELELSRNKKLSDMKPQTLKEMQLENTEDPTTNAEPIADLTDESIDVDQSNE
jgi:hypothetical protein